MSIKDDVKESSIFQRSCMDCGKNRIDIAADIVTHPMSVVCNII